MNFIEQKRVGATNGREWGIGISVGATDGRVWVLMAPYINSRSSVAPTLDITGGECY